jgi:hypothetical protein
MPRQNTRLESEGAEFLVLGQLSIAGIPTYKQPQALGGLLKPQPSDPC